MDGESIRRRCDEYIEEGAENPEYAIMLTGAWGCGKTHLIQKYISEQNEAGYRLAWYISLFGVKNIDEIDAKLFEAAHPIIGNESNKKYTAVLYNVLRSAAKHKYGIEIKDCVESFLDVITAKDDRPAGCRVLFVDDVERCHLEIAEIFGYFTPIIEGGTRVVFVANEKKLLERKAGTHEDTYTDIKEKLIGETYELSPDYDAALESFWKRERVPFGSKEDRRESLNTIVSAMAVKNLRVLRQTIHRWQKILPHIYSVCHEDESFIDLVFEEFIVLMIGYKLGEIASTESVADTTEGMIKHWNSYKGGHITYPLRCVAVWPAIITQGEDPSYDWVKKALQKSYVEYQTMLKNREATNRPIDIVKKMLFFSRDSGAIDLEENFEKMINDFKVGCYKSFSDIMLYIEIWLYLLEEEVLPKTYEHQTLTEQLKDFLDAYEMNIDLPSVYGRVPRDKFSDISNKALKDVIDRIFDAVQEKNGEFSHKIYEDGEVFRSYISNSNNVFDYPDDIPFLSKFKLPQLFSFLDDDLKTHENLLQFLKYRYREEITNAVLREVDYGDLDYVKKIENMYEGKCEKMKHQFRLDLREYKKITEGYKDLISYMEKVINNSQTKQRGDCDYMGKCNVQSVR